MHNEMDANEADHQQALGGEKYQLYRWLHVVIVCCFINFFDDELVFYFYNCFRLVNERLLLLNTL